MLALSAERPPLGELSEVMNPALPYVYGQAEDNSVSEKIRHHGSAAKSAADLGGWKIPVASTPSKWADYYEGDGR